MTTQTTKSAADGGRGSQPPPAPPGEVVDRLAELLPAEELQDAIKGLAPEQITGPGGLLTQLAGRVIETAPGAELTEYLGYAPGQAPPGGAGNHRNGSTPKTLQTELGPVDIKTPRDRAGSFEPALVAKRQTRLAGLDDKILALYAGGMSVRDIEEHLAELYGVEIKRDTISRVTDAVLADVEAWRTRPLERIYPIALPRGPRRRGRAGARGLRREVGREVPDDRAVLARPVGIHRPVPVAARRSAPRGLHHQQHREPQPPDPQEHQDPRPLPRRTGRHQTHLPRDSARRAQVAEGYNWTGALRGLKIHFGDRLHD
jgi:hypothetical protein